MAEDLALKAASLFANGAKYREISEDLEVSTSRVGKLVREGYSILENSNRNPDENTVIQPDDEPENNVENKDDFSLGEFRGDDRDLDELMNRTLLIHATPILRKVALNSKVFLQHEYLQKYLGYEGDVGDLLVEALNFYWKEMGFTIKIQHDSVV